MTHVVVGRPRPSRWQKLLGRRGVLDDLIGRGDGLTLVIVDAGTAFEAEPIVERPPPASASLDDLLVPNGVVAFDTPMTRADAVRRLAELAAGGDLDVAAVVTAIEEREAMGSTFLNAGVALPHARLPGLRSPRLSIGLPRAGIVDPPPGAESPEAIALLLTPDDDAGGHLKALARVARLLADPAAREALEASAVSRTGG